MKIPRNIIIAGAVCLVLGGAIGGAIGYAIGRITLAAVISNGPLEAAQFKRIQAAVAARSSSDDPIEVVDARITDNDLVVGLRNTTTNRTVVALSGWAYRFDAFERPITTRTLVDLSNKGNGFAKEIGTKDSTISPHEVTKFRFASFDENAATALAEITMVKFDDGTIWERN